MNRKINFWLYGFAALAAAGFVLSAASHVASLQSKPGPLGDRTWILHVGAMAICIPAILVARRLVHGVPRGEQWNALLSGCPAWMKYALYGFFAYAVVNFVIFMMTPAKSGQGFMPPATVRGFSGHWMAIYAAACVVLYSGARVLNKATRTVS